jgi:hypothetical protein
VAILVSEKASSEPIARYKKTSILLESIAHAIILHSRISANIRIAILSNQF